MEIGEYVDALRKRWWVILLLALVGTGLGYQQAKSTTPMYRSTAKAYVYLASGDSVSELAQGSTYTRNLVESFVQLTTVQAVLAPVIEELDLTVTPRQLASIVHAEAPLDTMIIDISASSRDPDRAADIANAVAGQLSRTIEDLSPASGENTPSVQVSVVDPAVPAPAPYAPNTRMLVATGLAVGLGIGGVIALVWARLDTRVRGVRDLPQDPARVLLGSVPHDRALAHGGPRTILEHPRSVVAESYRRIRANLDFLDSTEPVRSFVVSSTLPGEGKSTTSVNLALAIADTGRRVLLIDADLRRPAIAEMCGLEGEVGLTTILSRRATLTEVRQPWGLETLDIVTAGRVPPNPTQLIDSAALADLLVEAQARYDCVIVDTSPLLAVTDAAVLARRTSGVLLVARARKVDRRQLEEALGSLDAIGARCLGLVLNGGPHRRRATSYGYMEPVRRSRWGRRRRRGAPAEAVSVPFVVAPSHVDAPVVPPSHVDAPVVPPHLDAPVAAPSDAPVAGPAAAVAPPSPAAVQAAPGGDAAPAPATSGADPTGDGGAHRAADQRDDRDDRPRPDRAGEHHERLATVPADDAPGHGEDRT